MPTSGSSPEVAADDAHAPNPQLESYYASLESRIGYRLVLGGTRHFGYWDRDTYWPFPISASLRAMEDKLAEALALPKGAEVLDAGCGVGHVAIRMAKTHGLRVSAIDIIDHHIAKARRNVARSGLPDGVITVRQMDYHDLGSLPARSCDGVYTIETFVHATNPEAVLAGFHRILRPGGHIALFEYEHEFSHESTDEMAASLRKINQYAAMPTNARSQPGVFKRMLEDAGFENVVVRDYSENIKPMTRFFFILAIVPYFLVRLLRLERYFINTVTGVQSYRGRKHWRYVAISASKPEGPLEISKNQ
ncbi:27-O-demethylrifamycin SV methyltransferase [Madurella fahalii]|uniref:27-O-demethylrifamycin SV methyltransferase n=1 Tax=Madurella fahalii TaxID=1157608 RepID=A0ABQ0GL30_9PEZI